ncbi:MULTISPECIES: DUF305 domain-containing protein [Streptomyces]|uniref:DUF305 domain-containing protein n=1 Tax=Streptomyces thermoviolaceus subsp. thermoviolaceus TaxID=66860 RepID=A0ABX0YQK9_STRTL|nr:MULTISPECIES: DUF305 domain-containing protein [Streptomyces]MCM3262695.1 DUF305 domain-containing protein [Streptomyces thermoviolaceus]NJP14876.1 DUF305 domain-containing protein [Streptomyces thermoviolaceus subsp. thermoviolaceus]RSS05393.1 DUF305 domain-containing protein [Streptomyces sp. WAC00469]WTD50249.1 DUF305 domain-containing protein [Streptomyces thermoviolaceus]GGV64274.1 hypothetical protein GCM10010499_07840 [Streptomyces thermoviolaceus subsp. apingens]
MLLTAACLLGVTGTSAGAQTGHMPAATAAGADPASTHAQVTANEADAQFVAMMIPHHQQALVLSRMAPSRSGDSDVRALADRIDVEQGLEIYMMQSWQEWNGLEKTDPQRAYEEMLQDPMMVEMMGMATPEELDQLSAATGDAFDVQYLRLMIKHHNGAIGMLEDVLANGTDETLQTWATDMLANQYAQVQMMQQMLDDRTKATRTEARTT